MPLDSHTLKMERKHIRAQLINERRPEDMHRLIDSVFSEAIVELPREKTLRRRAEWKRDLCIASLRSVHEKLDSMGTFGDADVLAREVNETLDKVCQ